MVSDQRLQSFVVGGSEDVAKALLERKQFGIIMDKSVIIIYITEGLKP